MTSKGKHIGLETAAAINEIVSEMQSKCAGDPVALADAASVVLHLLSLRNEDAPVTQVLRRLRREAIIEMAKSGQSDQQIADALGCSRGRVQQLRTHTSEGPRKATGGSHQPAQAPIVPFVVDVPPAA